MLGLILSNPSPLRISSWLTNFPSMISPYRFRSIKIILADIHWRLSSANYFLLCCCSYSITLFLPPRSVENSLISFTLLLFTLYPSLYYICIFPRHFLAGGSQAPGSAWLCLCYTPNNIPALEKHWKFCLFLKTTSYYGTLTALELTM